MNDGLVTVLQCPSCVDGRGLVVTIVRCPFCVGGRGTVAFDLEAVRTVSGTTMGHTNLERVGYLVFDPGRAPAGTCPHLIHLEAEASWEHHGGEISIRHPALIAADPDRDLIYYMWEVLSARRPETVTPTTPYKFVRGDIEGPTPVDSDYVSWCGESDVLYAADPTRFVQECQVLDVQFGREGRRRKQRN